MAVALVGQKYVFGGGHNSSFMPSVGLTKGPTKGYDCSGLISAIVHGGGELTEPLGTHEVEHDWGLSGEGEFFTWWVVNGFVNGVFTEHCVAEFPQAPSDHRFFMAYFTGGPPAGFAREFDTTHYHAKRKKIG